MSQQQREYPLGGVRRQVAKVKECFVQLQVYQSYIRTSDICIRRIGLYNVPEEKIVHSIALCKIWVAVLNGK
jgi:hypothetical protein